VASRRGQLYTPSVRVRTTALATVLVGTVLAAGAVLLVATLDRSLVSSDDGVNKARAQDLLALAVAGDLPPALSNINDQGVAQVVDQEGRVLASSSNVRGAAPIASFRPRGSGPTVRTVVNAPDDDEVESYRVWAASARTSRGRVTAYVGTSLERVPEASRQLRRTLWLGVPVILLLVGAATWAMVGRALRPVEAIRARVVGISKGALDLRVPVPAAHDEIGRLAVTMNRMLDRMEDAHLRQRQFVADASHELQSPIAAIRAQLEVALAHPNRMDWTTLAYDVLEDCAQVELLLRDLLFLAKEQEGGLLPLRREPLDLDDIVMEEVARVRAPAHAVVDTSRVSGAPVTGSRDELRRLVRNLVENAVRHAETQVWLTLSTSDGYSRLEVVDDGPGIAASERPKVFDRFYRGDTARARESGGTGLGLSIAHTIAERHGGRLDLADRDGGAHFVLVLPTHPC